MLCLIIDFKMRKFSGFFICLRNLGKNFPKSVVLCSQKFCGLPEMVKNPFWYKKYKNRNYLKASINCSMWVVYWRLLNRFSGGLLNILLMLGLHHRCLPDILRKYFKILDGCFWDLTFTKFWFLKKGKLL